MSILVLAIFALLEVELTDLNALQIELVLSRQVLVLRGHLAVSHHIMELFVTIADLSARCIEESIHVRFCFELLRIRIGFVDGIQICARIELLDGRSLGGILHLLVVDGDALLADVFHLDVVVVAEFFLGYTTEHLIKLEFILAEILVQLNIIHIQILNIVLMTQH